MKFLCKKFSCFCYFLRCYISRSHWRCLQPRAYENFQNTFSKIANGHVVSVCACAAWHVCVTAFSKRICVLLTDLTVHHVSFLYTLYYIQPGLKAKLSLIFVASQTKRQNKSIGLISQNFCTYSTPFCTFLWRCFARLQRRPRYTTFYGRNVVCVPVRIFFTARSFSPWWPLEFFIFAPPL